MHTFDLFPNLDKEFIIPCSNEDEQTTSFPVSSAEVTHLSGTISDSTKTEYNGATWNRKFLIWTILSSVMLCYP
ncbi:hypothetical protein FGIG_05944 [Fasciola gigantica]|uniref:Uncharacterized protein n=1 Tax=Fasciola gigantica TaxID=46835 RepID=A0A504YSG9_FASGI|nr:hypothetical protein FGIG_05944 [Fasciola gigantica]